MKYYVLIDRVYQLEQPIHHLKPLEGIHLIFRNLFVFKSNNFRCKCPEEYTPRLYRGSHCTCDCAEGNIDCAQIKRGKEFFSLKDRL